MMKRDLKNCTIVAGEVKGNAPYRNKFNSA